MKRKVADAEQKFVSLKLYKKDLEELLSIFTSIFGGYRLSDNQYEFDSLNELQERRGTVIKYLTIGSPSSSLELDIGNETKLRRTGEPEAVTAFAQIVTLLDGCKRPLLNTFLHPLLYIPLMFLPIVFIIIFRKRIDVEWAQGVFLVFFILAMIPAAIHFTGGFSRIVLTEKHEEQTFWTRNRDNLWLLLVGAVIGSILTYIPMLIRWMISRF
jgi:hypothetical protein